MLLAIFAVVGRNKVSLELCWCVLWGGLCRGQAGGTGIYWKQAGWEQLQPHALCWVRVEPWETPCSPFGPTASWVLLGQDEHSRGLGWAAV